MSNHRSTEEFETSSTKSAEGGRPGGHEGFTLVELTVVMTLTIILMGFASVLFRGYVEKVSAQRAAQVFAHDLTLARSAALRGQQSVSIRFFETAGWYTMTLQESGTELARRTFGPDGDINLVDVDLRMDGDSVVFNSRGTAELSSGLGEADFTVDGIGYRVSFNAMGATRIEEL